MRVISDHEAITTMIENMCKDKLIMLTIHHVAKTYRVTVRWAGWYEISMEGLTLLEAVTAIHAVIKPMLDEIERKAAEL